MSRVRQIVDRMFEGEPTGAPDAVPPSEEEKRRNAWRYREKRSTGVAQTPLPKSGAGPSRGPLSTRGEIKRTFF